MANWVKIQSKFPYMWYMLSDEGEIYREKIIYVDYNGHLSGRNPKYFKPGTHPIIKKYKVSKFFSKQHNCYKVRLNIFDDSKESKKISLHVLLAKYFLPPKPEDGKEYILKFIDGNSRNCVASNLQWKSAIENLKDISDKKFPLHIGIYEVSENHPVYKEYQEYLKNNSRLSQLVFQFMKENNLFCGLVKAGFEQKIKKRKDEYVTVAYPYFMIKDEDPDVLKHDLDILKDSLKKEEKGFYPIALKSEYMSKWVNKLQKENFKIKNVPSIKEYITLHKIKKGSLNDGKYYHSFAMENGELYVRIETVNPFDLTDDFIQASGKEYLFEGEIR